MTILIIHSSPRSNGCSSTIARNIAKKFEGASLLEINLHKENLPYCAGCLNCVKKSIEACPHSKQTLLMRDKMLQADLIIVATPVYILHMTGQLKAFIDHFPSIFLMHRPEKAMFSKQLIIVATAAGPVCKQTLKEISGIFTQFGISRIYKLGFAVASPTYNSIKKEKLLKIEKQSNKVIKKVKRNIFKPKVSLKIRFNFFIYKMVQKKFPASDADGKHWQQNNWFKTGRPWK
ncbi:MAG: NAD(P)H-dependent oxidoreductase [Sphaerochaetaceae bacterium]|nr:NAD(P)H-dependent oxidoreductase [Sphaerochaetaceae bacterium]